MSRVSHAVGHEWVRLSDYVDKEAVAELLAAQHEYLHGGTSLAARALVSQLVGVPTLMLSMAVAGEGRLPVASPDDVWVRWIDEGDGPTLESVAFTSGRMIVLPDDPMADEPQVTAVSGREELGAELVAMVHRLAAEFVATVARVSRRTEGALWRTLSDRIVNGYLLVARDGGDVDAAQREVDAVLGAAPRPLHRDWFAERN